MHAARRRSKRPALTRSLARWALGSALASASIAGLTSSAWADDASGTPPTSEPAAPASPDGPASPALPALVAAPDDEEAIPPPPSGEPASLDPEGPDAAGIELVPAPPTPRSREEAEAEEERRDARALEEAPPRPLPEWRLRAGAGVGIPVSGSSTPTLRLHQEVEWQPEAVAPFVFGVGGAEYLLGGVFGSVGGRFGMATLFCENEVMRCQGAVSIVLGAFLGEHLAAFDVGGEGDVRLLFGDAFELSLRGGFDGGGGVNMIHVDLGLAAAF